LNQFHRKTCFIFPAYSSIAHLWFVITNVDDFGNFITVNASTSRQGSDRTTVLNRGDHPFIKHESVIRYDEARKHHISYFEKAGTLLQIHHSESSESLIQRIHDGFFTSPATPKDIKDYLEKTIIK